MTIFTYTRISSLDQKTDPQTLALKTAHPNAVHQEKNKSGTTATGMAFIQMLSAFAEFENNPRKKRQLTGIKEAKARGNHLGRKPVLTDKQKQDIRYQHQRAMNPNFLTKMYGVSRVTSYNVIIQLA